MTGNAALTIPDVCEKTHTDISGQPAIDWSEIQTILQKRCGSAYELWLTSLRPASPLLDPSTGIARFSVPTPFLRIWLSDHYTGAILASLADAGITASSLSITTRGLHTAKVHPQLDAASAQTRARKSASPHPPEPAEDIYIDRNATDEASFAELHNAARRILAHRSYKAIHLEDIVDRLPDDLYTTAREIIRSHVDDFGCPPSRHMLLTTLFDNYSEIRERLGNPPLTCDTILLCSRHFEIPPNEIIGQARRTPVTRTRQTAMSIIKRVSGRSLPSIGRRFGGRDHTTVLHSLKVINAAMEADADYCKTILSLEATADMIAWLRVKDWLGSNQKMIPEELRSAIGFNSERSEYAEEFCENYNLSALIPDEDPLTLPQEQLSLFAA